MRRRRPTGRARGPANCSPTSCSERFAIAAQVGMAQREAVHRACCRTAAARSPRPRPARGCGRARAAARRCSDGRRRSAAMRVDDGAGFVEGDAASGTSVRMPSSAMPAAARSSGVLRLPKRTPAKRTRGHAERAIAMHARHASPAAMRAGHGAAQALRRARARPAAAVRRRLRAHAPSRRLQRASVAQRGSRSP